MPDATPVSGLRLILATALFAVGGGICIGVAVLVRHLTAFSGADVGAVLLFVLYLLLLAVLVASFGGWAGVRQVLGLRFTRWEDIGLALAVWVAAILAGGVLTLLLMPILGKPQSNVDPLLGLSRDRLFVGLIVPTTAVLAPLAEELYFRGALFGWLRQKIGPGLGAVLASAIFAGAHLSITLLPILFTLGLGAAFIYQRTGSTLNSFVLHASQNLFAVVGYYLAVGR